MAVVLFLLLRRFFGTVFLSILLGMLDHWTCYAVFEIVDSTVVFLYLTLF